MSFDFFDEFDAVDRTQVELAIIQRDHVRLEDLLKDGADPDDASASRQPPLALALNNEDVESARLLIEYGADLSWKNGGLTYLHYAATSSSAEPVQLLLDEGMDPCVLGLVALGSGNGREPHTALYLAREGGYTETAEVLEPVSRNCPLL